MFSLVIHAGYKGSDHCIKKLHNPPTRIMYFFMQCRLHIMREVPKKEFFKINPC